MPDTSQAQPVLAPANVYLLAEHLDAALAAGEDLGNVSHVWRGPAPCAAEDIVEFRTQQRDTVERARTLELSLLSRILISRDRANELACDNKRFSAIARLYVSSTAILTDAVEECGDSTEIDFDTADGLTAYLRGRGLLAKDAPVLDDTAPLKLNDNAFLVARRLPLGVLLDLVSAFLDALNAEYDLFPSDRSGEPASTCRPANALA